MCKGISLVLTKDREYHNPDSNSHTEINKLHKIRDNKIDGLLPVELYPRGKSIFSKNHDDWQVVFETSPSWHDEIIDADRALNHLFERIMPEWKEAGKIKASVDLSGLGYKELPQDFCELATTVNCSGNQLTTLTLPKATWVYCYGNQLTKLTLPKATTVYCSGNPKSFTEKDWKGGGK